jgi:hypothetical protein
MRAKEFALMSRCVEDGVAYGYQRAHKYTEKPTEEEIRQAIYDAVLNEICDCFYLDEGVGDGS